MHAKTNNRVNTVIMELSVLARIGLFKSQIAHIVA